MDPVKQIVTPIAEIRKVASRRIDEFGEEWVVIDGIETKVPSVAAAKALCARQDAIRVKIRADLDEKGLRFNPDGSDREEQVEITLDDGTVTTVGLMKLGDDANYMQIGEFPDAPGLFANAQKAQDAADAKAKAEKQQTMREATARSPLAKIRDTVMGFLGKETR